MNALTRVRAALHGARRRRTIDFLLAWSPWVLLISVLLWRLLDLRSAALFVLPMLAALWFMARIRMLRLDDAWLVRELDARRPDLEDSTDLLFAQPESLTTLERLQVQRLQSRLESGPVPDLRPRWSTRAIALGLVVAAVGVAAILAWPERQPVTFDNVLANIGVSTAKPTHTRIVTQTLAIAPPAYTRQPARESATLDAKAPQGTRLQWTLRFAPQPEGAELVFHDGRRVALTREGDVWRATDVLARSALYRVVLQDAPPLQKQTLHRLDAIADRPPELRVVAPDRGLTQMKSGQRAWSLAFEGSDDYGVSPSARLHITIAHGSGESIEFREQEFGVGGAGAATSKRYLRTLDLAALGMTEGDDLVAQLHVDDNRVPGPQSARSASVILRWPPDLGAEATGVEGMVKKVLPAYFRSQRQIIIDAEALLKQRRALASERFTKRSDEIGVDQRILRLRYGQFLGEEAEGDPQPPPTNDPADAHADADGHDHAAEPVPTAPTFGQETAVVEQFGHTHDEPEAATLLDPDTRATLKKALDQMWQSELHLRQGQPQDALPYAYRALGFIKEVQQATRIYLARVGTELPPIDESRRMSGERGAITRGDALVAATAADPVLSDLWRALDGTSAIDYASLERWLRDHQSQLRDPLAFVAAIEALRADPQCDRCRRDLRALLWPLLPRPPANAERRAGDDATSRAYLDALREGRAP
ncbi:putative transmembrane protein [Lysobacter dokdonensis DS-58]|uniref:Putative transmembrane protein n=1 Tax=Lysobacter dokdonensis DS-58 TaxID=1300345 RepID=A0A0A2WGP2_9GAMM|nr:hypothetical protein [Lysobacter dokdonensis]KGQ19356.1 putative transmembrane protein [Lysobacter dokdonensis DS-58]